MCFFGAVKSKGSRTVQSKIADFVKKKISLESRFFSKSGDVAKRLSQSSPHRAYCFTSCFGAGHVWRLWRTAGRRMKTCWGSKDFSERGWGVDGEADEVIWHYPLCLTPSPRALNSRQSACLSHCTRGRRGVWCEMRWTGGRSGDRFLQKWVFEPPSLCSNIELYFSIFVSHPNFEPLFRRRVKSVMFRL